MAVINLSRRALIDWIGVCGDTFAPGPVSFVIDNVNEDFSESTLTLTAKKDGKTIKQLTTGSGILVSGNVVQYSISAADIAALFAPGDYYYEVQKETGSLVETIQHGTIKILK